MKRNYFLSVSLFIWVHCYAQTDSSILLGQVIVSSRLDVFSTGNKIQQADSFTHIPLRYASLADMLQSQTPVFIKSYGNGGIASSSFRGAGAEHTAVLWNGINIQSAVNGGVDFSIIPMQSFNDASLQFGGNSALFGSGAVGGVVRINNTLAFKKATHIIAASQLGSFGSRGMQLGTLVSTPKWVIQLNAGAQGAKNNFLFNNTTLPGSPQMLMQHAETQSASGILSAGIKTGKYHVTKIHAWYTTADRNLPTYMYANLSSATLSDQTLRTLASWEYQKNSYAVVFKQAYFKEWQKYTDTVSSIVSTLNLQSSISEAELRWNTGKYFSFNSGINNTYNYATSDGYNGAQAMNRTAFFASVKNKQSIAHLDASLNMRMEYAAGKWLPVTPSLGLEYALSKHFRIATSSAYSYRIATLNERYWAPGGNPNLKPEHGWNHEASLHTLFGTNTKLSVTQTLFTRQISDWIQWVPTASYVSPENIKSVFTRGYEHHIDFGFSLKKVSISYKQNLSYVLSTTQEVYDGKSDITGKQLRYVPRISHTHQAVISYKKAYLIYSHSYYGIRYTEADNSNWLNPYQLASVMAGTSFSYKKTVFECYYRINNIWNEVYQSVIWLPMPPVNHAFSIILTYKNS
jgi:iron complex outermembrane receptor protein